MNTSVLPRTSSPPSLPSPSLGLTDRLVLTLGTTLVRWVEQSEQRRTLRDQRRRDLVSRRYEVDQLRKQLEREHELVLSTMLRRML